MSKTGKEDLHRIMAVAWAFHRAATAEGPRSFSVSLKAAWRMHRGFEACALKLRGVRHLRLSPSLIRSPIGRVFQGDPANESGAAYISSMFGQ
jgi:hypothetical protein